MFVSACAHGISTAPSPPLPPFPPPQHKHINYLEANSSYDMYPLIKFHQAVIGQTIAFTRCYLKDNQPKTSGYIVGKIVHIDLDCMKFHVEASYENTHDKEFIEESLNFTRNENELNGVTALDFDADDKPKCYAFDCREVVVLRLMHDVNINCASNIDNKIDTADGDIVNTLAQRKRELLASL